MQKVTFTKTAEQFREYARRGIEKQIKAGNLSNRDSELIYEFIEEVKIQSNISPAREYKITNALSNISRFFDCHYSDAKLSDVYSAVNRIKTADKIKCKNTHGGKLSVDSQKDYIIFLKRFYLWMIDEGYIELSKDKILKIKPPSAKKISKTADELLTEEDILKLIQKGCVGCTQTRDRALIAVFYETGCRIHELAKMQWKDIDFSNKHFLQIDIVGKTNIPRRVPITTAREYLCKWKSEYPGDAIGNNPVFLSNRNKTFNYQYLKKHLEDIAERAGVDKFKPHTMRHSRITILHQQGFSESSIKMIGWGSLSSNMLSRYSHLTTNDVLNEFNRKAGYTDEETTPAPKFQNKVCMRCHTLNPPTNHICSVCGECLDEETALELENMKTQIHEDDRYKEIINSLAKKIEALEAIVK